MVSNCHKTDFTVYCQLSTYSWCKTHHCYCHSADPPIITSIVASSLIHKTSGAVVRVPRGFTGVVLTCNGIGSPEPTIMWTRSGMVFDPKRMSTSMFRGESNSPFISATLTIMVGFGSSDSGEYVCVMQMNGSATSTQSKSVMLLLGKPQKPQRTESDACPIANGTYFQLRFLATHCRDWDIRTLPKLIQSLEMTVRSVVHSECQACKQIKIKRGPVCSSVVPRAAVFWGSVSTKDTDLRQRIFCNLSVWQQKTPLVSFVDAETFYVADKDCPLVVSSLYDAECENLSGQSGSSRSLSTAVFTLTGLLLVLNLLLVAGHVFLYRLRQKKKRY